MVAIKTMALKQAFDADEMVELKGRFLREAESAGRLTHPNIVTVFGADGLHRDGVSSRAFSFLQVRKTAGFDRVLHRSARSRTRWIMRIARMWFTM